MFIKPKWLVVTNTRRHSDYLVCDGNSKMFYLRNSDHVYLLTCVQLIRHLQFQEPHGDEEGIENNCGVDELKITPADSAVCVSLPDK